MFIRIQAGDGFADAGENGTRRGITSDTRRHQCGKLYYLVFTSTSKGLFFIAELIYTLLKQLKVK